MLAAMKHLLIGFVVTGFVGCSTDAAKPAAGACTPDANGAMSLSSPSFASCAAIPATNAANTCAPGAMNSSPPLAWSGAPSGTQSFAVVLTDLSIDLTHWVIYDIPAATTSLPAAVDNAYAPSKVAGAHQTVGLGSTRGYSGPCPPSPHTYQFKVHAIKLATLPAGEDTTSDEALSWIADNESASATLTATFSP